jgi:hypothetical protein
LKQIGNEDSDSKETHNVAIESNDIELGNAVSTLSSNGLENNSELTYDGYQTILLENSRSTREDELHAMRAARLQNRGGQSSLEKDVRLGGRYEGNVR